MPGKPRTRADESGPVLDANRDFYRAFRTKDMGTMERLWAEAVDLVCVHPGWSALTERSQILESWRGILEGSNSPPISCQDESVRFMGDTAVVVCTEMIGDNILVATNIFVREQGAWRMSLHHATPTARAAAPRRAETPKTLH